jgi:hypothetical protein
VSECDREASIMRRSWPTSGFAPRKKKERNRINYQTLSPVSGSIIKNDNWGNYAQDRDRSLVSVVCCQVEVSATSWSLVQRSPTECGVSKLCDCEASKNEAA